MPIVRTKLGPKPQKSCYLIAHQDALDMSILSLADPGQNILIPQPGFPLYSTIAHGHGIETRDYNLLPERGWNVDLEHMESQVSNKTFLPLPHPNQTTFLHQDFKYVSKSQF